ncbi:MAG: HEAT repeat domain-containing protein [Fuerstiella sp.]
MNDAVEVESASSDPDASAGIRPPARPEDLPPVEPPSAGHIVQLFLIPALIVAAVIGVWALFGKLADDETDWQQLVAELGSSNEHRRWRAALGLAQVLRNQQLAPPEDEVPLAEQPEVATALTDLLRDSLASASTLDEDIKHQEFLARTLGALQADDVVLPVLADALQPDRHEDVRKSSLMSLAMIAGRHFEQRAASADRLEPDRVYESGQSVVTLVAPLEAPTIDSPAVADQLKQAAQDVNPAIRHLAAFVLALVSGEDAVNQLKAMLLDRDPMARANAAIGLVRNGQTDGVPVLTDLLKESMEDVSRDEFQALTPEEQQSALKNQQFEKPVMLSNSLRALDSIWVAIDSEQKTELEPILRQLADESSAADIRLQAQSLLARVRNSAE